jgi:hypothetical protein
MLGQLQQNPHTSAANCAVRYHQETERACLVSLDGRNAELIGILFIHCALANNRCVIENSSLDDPASSARCRATVMIHMDTE